MQERFDNRGAFAVAALGLAVSAWGFFGVVSLPLLGALFCALFTGAAAFQLTRIVRERTGTRMASLTRREVAGMIPRWYLGLPAVGWCCGAYFGIESQQWAAAAVAVCASIAAVVLCFFVVAAPAIVGNEDPAADEAVDHMLRTLQMSQLLFVAAAGPFILVELIFIPHDELSVLVRLACTASYFWMALCLVQSRKRAHGDIAKFLGNA